LKGSNVINFIPKKEKLMNKVKTQNRYSERQKKTFVAESLLPGNSTFKIAKQHKIDINLLKKWQHQYEFDRFVTTIVQNHKNREADNISLTLKEDEAIDKIEYPLYQEAAPVEQEKNISENFELSYTNNINEKISSLEKNIKHIRYLFFIFFCYCIINIVINLLNRVLT
jgi:transposase-like protein